MSEYEQKDIQIHEETDSVVLASMRGGKNPIAIINDELLDRLLVKLRRAIEELESQEKSINLEATRGLIEDLGKILELYEKTRNKIYGGFGPEREYDSLNNEVKNLMNELNKFGEK